MTLGDVLAVIAAVMLVGASWASAILMIALAFPAKVGTAQEKLMSAPGWCAGRGAVTVAVGGLLALLLSQAAAGPARLLAAVILGALGIVASVGSAAIVRLLGARIDALGSPMTQFASLTRASFLYVGAGFFPVIGWLAILPAALFLSVGCGLPALFRFKPKQRPVSPISAPTAMDMEIVA
jgi:hypothetical protein